MTIVNPPLAGPEGKLPVEGTPMGPPPCWKLADALPIRKLPLYIFVSIAEIFPIFLAFAFPFVWGIAPGVDGPIGIVIGVLKDPNDFDLA